MYSMVLMSALATAPTTPDFNGYFRDLLFGDTPGCSGCCGGGAVRYNCYGGCSGSAAYQSGCCGGGLFSGERIRSFFDRLGGDGCCGGGYSARAAGCCGGTMAYTCSGCCGGSVAYACFGGTPVSYTPVFNGGLSCYGGPAPSAPAPVFDPYPSYPAPSIPGGPAPSIPYADPSPAPPAVVPERSGLRPAGFNGPATTMVGAGAGPGGRATVVVRLPADAKLYADGAPLRMTGGERKFSTPDLPGGMEYTYRFTAEYERNGEIVSVTRKVAVRAGGSAAVEFADLTATKAAPGSVDVAPAKTGEAVAAAPVSNPNPGPAPATVAAGEPKTLAPAVTPPAAVTPTVPATTTARATITVKLPADATLSVDDRKSPAGGPVRQFSTPAIPTGREFSYLIKAEVVRNGQPEQLIQKVGFQAGEQVVVDFTSLGGGR